MEYFHMTVLVIFFRYTSMLIVAAYTYKRQPLPSSLLYSHFTLDIIFAKMPLKKEKKLTRRITRHKAESVPNLPSPSMEDTECLPGILTTVSQEDLLLRGPTIRASADLKKDLSVKAPNNLGICGYLRNTDGHKDCVLHRRNPNPKRQPLEGLIINNELGKPIAELTTISQFMARHSSKLHAFKPYTLEDAHTLPRSAKVSPVNDPATAHLPPLAKEEYTLHISRLSYLMRELQLLENSDAEFFNDPRFQELLDKILDMEQQFVLPRVDFLRSHADTIRAMNQQSQRSTTADTEYAVGNHIQQMARALPRHPDFRSNNNGYSSSASLSLSDSNSSNNGYDSSVYTTDDGSVFGNRLNRIKRASWDTNSMGHSNVLNVRELATISGENTNEPKLSQYNDPKLHPVVVPRDMVVSPELEISGKNFVYSTK